MRVLPSLRLVLLASLVVGSLAAVAAPAHASFALTAPAENTTVAPGTTLALKYTATCPEGKACGSWDNYNVFGNVKFSFDHTAPPTGQRLFGNTWVYGQATGTSADLRIEDYANAGRWRISTDWTECPVTATPHPGPGLENCTQQQVERFVLVKPIVGTKQYRPYFAPSKATGNARGVANSLYFTCNAPVPVHRVTLVVQQQVKQGNRLLWKPVATAKDLRTAKDPESNVTRCVVKRTLTVPRSVPLTAKLRTQAVVRTAAFTPALAPTTLTTTTYTLASLSGGSGGGIVIGNG